MLPAWPPSRGLLSLIRRQGPIRLDQLYERASEHLAPGTFRSKSHYKECLALLRRSRKVNTFRKSKEGRGAQARDKIAVEAKGAEADRRWARTGRTLAKMNRAAVENAEQRTLTD